MENSSFSSRRAAAGSLPAFTLPPPNASEVPRAGDGLSPSLSSVNTASSQGSQAHHTNLQYTYSGQVHGGWPTPGNSSYHVSSAAHAQQPLGQSSYAGRTSMYGHQQQQPNMGFGNPRSSQSPATGADGLPAPPYESVHQTFSTPIPGGGGAAGGGQDGHHGMSPGQATHGAAMLTGHNSTQPPAPSAAPAPVDPYAHSRAPSNSSYYAVSSTPQQSSFPSYAPHSQHSPTNTGSASRGMGSISAQPPHPSMGPPTGSFRQYGTYQHLGQSLNGPVMSNIHQPGSQMAVIPGMGMPQAYGGHPLIYGHHSQPQQQSERPFKCDQCTQSFSRNHDLKRHKRIHLAVKPFPCNYCSKSFSRKDALKRHRLVKGCENKVNENAGGDVTGDRGGDGDDDRSSVGKET
ncbi:Transcriptional regulator prz1 [Tolypocladium capitatum]|uniref:Transcriptional regulator prz1 n=1 Tax=Tolypocladium capitatum TaxID=45235 RepID=A0A2K3QDA1_9HYPO|nr:Transcriptional regulator prz1 [Tolypocladium capitatum]